MLIVALFIGFISSFVYDYALLSRASSAWQRPRAALYLHSGTWFISCALLLLLCQRPWFALVLVNAGQLLLLLVHHAKQHSLREAFIYQDFDYFTDAIKHPRLYLPFFGIGRTIAATLAFVSAVGIGLLLETPLTLAVLLSSSFVLAVLGYGLIRLGLARCPAPSYEPARDLRTLGQVAFFWAYWRAERVPCLNLHSTELTIAAKQLDHKTKLPTIIVVQSESFFDPRPLSANIKPDVLKNFDAIKRHAKQYGTLTVPAWGANTVRTEAAFLTGLSPEQLGIHRFNPYRLLAKQAVTNLVSILKQHAYHTVCIHPYPASFYQRDQVFPRLGFDEFIDSKHFATVEHDNTGNENGQFIADLTVAAKIDSLLQTHTDNKPLFIFVITMENHGPLHLESATVADNERFYSQGPPSAWQDLTVYLKHLSNADTMMQRLQQNLTDYALKQGRDGVLCWYGDHVPIMPQVYATLGEPTGHSDYVIWHSATQQTANSPEQILSAHQLATALLSSV